MDVLDCIHTRRSIRKYTDQHVDKDTVGRIIDAGRQAPSAGNLQNWSFIYVQKKPNREALAEACHDQFWMVEAPVHIVVCANPDKVTSFYGTRGEQLYTVQHCAAAVQNMLLAAHALGLGACWVGSFDEGKVRSAVGIPDNIKVQVVVTVGYPAEDPEKPSHYKLFDQAYLESYGAKLHDALLATKDYAWSAENRWKAKKQELKENSPQLLDKGKKLLSEVSRKLSGKKRPEDKE